MQINKEKVITVSAGTGKFSIRGIGIPTDGNGVIVCILGGEIPHVGAVAIGIPRAGLRHTEGKSATCSVFTLVGHMEDEVAKPASWKIAQELNQAAVVIAGIHIESEPAYHSSESDIKTLIANTKEVTDKLIAEFKKQAGTTQQKTAAH
jgi:hypothetical protein